MKLALIFSLVITLTACSHDDSSSPATNPAQPNTKTADPNVATDYVQMGELVLIHSGDSLATANPNELSLKGTGAKSTYKFQYKFNSGSHSVIRLMKVETSQEANDCSINSVQLKLKHGSHSESLSADIKTQVNPDTDYVIEAEAKQSCDSLSLKMGIMVWADTNGGADAYFARQCETSRSQQMTFFAVNAVSGFLRNDKVFLGFDSYCGVGMPMDQTSCKTTSSFGDFLGDVKCVAGDMPNQRSFELTFDPKTKTGRFVCKKNEAVVYPELLSNCEDKILDYQSYKF